MTGTPSMPAYADPSGPSAESMRLALPELADGLHGQFLELHKRPSADAAETLARNLDGARLAVMRFRERLIAEASNGETPTV